jgi:hypothetical protein
MSRISAELVVKVDSLMIERAYDMCPIEVGTIMKYIGKGYTDWHYAYVRRIRADRENAFELQVVPLTKRLKRHQKYGISSNYIWHHSIKRWAVHRTGYSMESIGEKTGSEDHNALESQRKARERTNA